MKAISIDIDGVIANSFISKLNFTLLQYYLSRRRTAKEWYSSIEQSVHRFVYTHPTRIIPTATKAINMLNQYSYKVVLNSARPSFLQETTKLWLIKNNVHQLIDKINLRNVGISPTNAKLSSMIDNNASIHIDDDPYIAEELSKNEKVEKIYFIQSNRYPKSVIEELKKNKKITIKPTLLSAVEEIIKDNK